jgi:hypothetical protein
MKLDFYNNERGLSGIVEAIVGSIITFIAMSMAALLITNGLQSSLESRNIIKASNIAEQVINEAKSADYRNVGVLLGEDNIINLTSGKLTGCEPFSYTFEGGSSLVKSSGLEYCQVKPDGGLNFNVQTQVTLVDAAALNAKIDSSNPVLLNNFFGKKVTVVVTWHEGEQNELGQPIMKSLRTETLLTPRLSDCGPLYLTYDGGCNS